MNYEIQFAKITNSGKLPDRFLTCQHHTTHDIAKKQMGEIFTLVEMLSPWFPTAQVGQTIISNFVKYYYLGGSTSDLVNFENSLKRINEDLAQITQNGETDWIGNLNALLAVVVGNNLHLATTGRVEAYIFRDGKINHLTANLAGPVEPHPLKTFSNIISGELKSQDKIVLTNPQLFDHLSLESIRELVTINNPSLAGLQITKLLRKERVKKVNLMIIELGSKEEASGQTLEGQLEDVFYLDKSTNSIFSKIIGWPKAIFSGGGKILAGASRKSYGKITASLKNRSKKTETPAEIEKKPTPSNDDRFQKEFLSKDDRDDNLLKDEEIKYSPDLYVHYYNAEKKEQKQTNGPKATAKILNILNWIWSKILDAINLIISMAHDRSRRKYLFIGGALIIILVLSLVVYFKSRGNQVGNLNAQKILDSAIAAHKDGQTSISQGNQDKAKQQFNDCINQSLSIIDKTLVAKDAQNTLQSCYSELDKMTATTRFGNLSPLATISDTAKGLFVVAGQSYILTDSDIYTANLVGGAPSKITSIPKSKGNFVAGNVADKIIYFYTSGQNVYEFDTASKQLELAKIASNGRWETANAAAIYVNTLYLLDGVLGQIYKHSSSQQEFAAGEEYISTANINLQDSVSLAVDGSIYVLKNSGKLIKLQKSRLVSDFALKNIPTPNNTLSKPIKVYTDSDTPTIYILDAGQKRIVEFDKDGQFVHQYALPTSFDKISDFAVSQKSRKIWILEKNSVYEIAI